MKTKIKNHFKLKKGFSIGEVLIALFVLAFGTVTAIYLMTGSIQDTMRGRDLLVASMLSQEGTELMRNIRDNNVTEKDVTTGVRDDVFEGFPSSDGGNCTVDYEYNVNTNNDGAFRRVALDCSSPSYQMYLKENDGNFFYTHQTTNRQTKFKRKIIINTEKVGVESITSMVVWNDRDFPNSIDDCNIGQNCVFSQTALTAWLKFED